MSRFLIAALALGISLLCGCASLQDPDRPYTLIRSDEGWVQMKAPPDDSAAIVASAGEGIKQMLDDRKKYKVTWFSRKADDYLIYFQLRDPSATCGDEAPEFYKDEDGRWVVDRLSRISICK